MPTKQHSSKLNNSLGIWILLSIGLILCICGALSIVWIRQHIGNCAQKSISIEKEIHFLNRRTAYLESKIAKLHTSELLRKKVCLSHQLTFPQKKQIVWLLPTRQPSIDKSNAIPASKERLTLAMNACYKKTSF